MARSTASISLVATARVLATVVAAMVATTAPATTQDLHLTTPRHYTLTPGWNSAAQYRWDGRPVTTTPRWVGRADEFIHGSLRGPDGSSWFSIARDVNHAFQEGDLVHVDPDGVERRFGRLWTADNPTQRFTGSMALHADGRMFLATPARFELVGGRTRVDNAEILAVDPTTGTVETIVAGPDLQPFVAGFHEGVVTGLHWRDTPGGVELRFGLSLVNTTSRFDLLAWAPSTGLRRVRTLATMAFGMDRFEDNPPDLVAHGDDLYFVTPFVIPFVHGQPIQPATLWHLDLATDTRTRIASIPFDPGSTVRGFQGLAATHDGQVFYGRRLALGMQRPVSFELFRYDGRRGTHDNLGEVMTLPAHAGIASISRFTLSTHTLSPIGVADVDHDFRKTAADLQIMSALFAAQHPRADLDGDLDVDLDDAWAFVRSWYE